VLSLAGMAMLLAAPDVVRAEPAFATPGRCQQGTLASGARTLICVPTNGWNGSLVVFAHGYVSPFAPLEFANLELPDGTRLPELVQQLGFAFATTSFRQNGLAILEGVDDIVDLVKAFPVIRYGPPARTYVTGVSEGGLVALLAAEQFPDLFEGAYAACGPVGNFQFQVNYIGDFRVLFDAYFPGVLPGSPVEIPAVVPARWDDLYLPAIRRAIRESPARARELLSVARVPYDASDATTVVEATTGLLWYNVFGTNDARAKLGGNPYGNRFRWYFGSTNDMSLNLRVKRVDADVPALVKLQRYTPSGDLRIPLITLHTTGDESVPYAQELLFAAKVRTSDRGRFLPLPVIRYGHCAFTTSEVLTGFALMLGASSVSTTTSGPVAEASLPAEGVYAARSLAQH
jgi:pimeloyl-ACP methyl ester carboxylesterase